MALKFTWVVVKASVRMSGALALMLPETMELTIVSVLFTVLVRNTPPPPVTLAVAVPLAVLAVMVLF
jgi:hypothetical protein